MLFWMCSNYSLMLIYYCTTAIKDMDCVQIETRVKPRVSMVIIKNNIIRPAAMHRSHQNEGSAISQNRIDHSPHPPCGMRRGGPPPQLRLQSPSKVQRRNTHD